MPITMPDVDMVKVAYDYPPAIPGVLSGTFTSPGPLVIKTGVSRSDGMPVFEKAAGANNGGYIGFGLINDTSAGNGIGALRATVIAGLAGMTAGSEVFMDAADGTLTHTALDNGAAIGKALTATMLYVY